MPDLSFVIKAVDQSCAGHVPYVFRSVYGDAFPIEYVYDADLTMREIKEGRLAAALAFDGEGEPIGYISAFKCAPNPLLWEFGNLVVVPGRGSDDLSWSLFQHYLEPGGLPGPPCDGIFGEAVCHHYFSQIGASKAGFCDCAIALDQLDAASFGGNKPDVDRIACLFMFHEQSDPESACFLPDQYLEFLRRLYGPLRPRILQSGSAPLPAAGKTAREDHWYAKAAMWRISVSSIGKDWRTFLDDLRDLSRERRVTSLQVVLSAGIPCMTEAVEEMHKRGFFLGGLFPRWFGADGIMLQRVLGKEPDFQGIKLYGKTARELLTFIQNDRMTVMGRG